MKLTREEREQVKACIGEMIAGEPITEDELDLHRMATALRLSVFDSHCNDRTA
jgi:hypothetical protein